MINPELIKKDFKLFENNPTIKYLDSGATALTPNIVVEAMQEYYYQYPGTVHRGVYNLSFLATSAFEESRSVAAKFLNAKQDNEIIFTKGTTASLNHLANSLSTTINDGDEIIVSNMEHHANFVP